MAIYNSYVKLPEGTATYPDEYKNLQHADVALLLVTFSHIQRTLHSQMTLNLTAYNLMNFVGFV